MIINRSITGINFAILLLAAYFSVNIVYNVVDMQLSRKRPLPVFQNTETPQETIINHPETHYQLVLDRNLFKVATMVVKKELPKLDPDSLEQTKLQLKLWGTVSGEGNALYAVIEETTNRQQNLYRIGDAIQNAKVRAILREKVILNVNGKDEVLGMEEMTLGGGSGTRRNIPTRTPTSTVAGTRPQSQKITLRRSLIEDSVQDISKLMTEVQIRPYLENGAPAGLALSNIKPNSIFRRMGLRNGDIITGVDGQNIQSVDDALKLYENLRSSSNVNVDIKRRGRERNIEYQIR
ncbi:MAG: PDZ domain-containing protein [Desulfobacteraceae bacterium]|nr:PDZ domain-containing protein [Desulfobacteraceae bacterium]